MNWFWKNMIILTFLVDAFLFVVASTQGDWASVALSCAIGLVLRSLWRIWQ